VVAYDYNSQQPRFFSKYFAHEDAGIYDVPIGNATGASSAAPTYFDPKVQKNLYGLTEMQIDGGIICNNPAFYAYQIANSFNGKKNIRVLSLGTGEKEFNAFAA
jgi:patatin-like phospholipase/acyl hydrolase